jgi:hypothetical protein
MTFKAGEKRAGTPDREPRWALHGMVVVTLLLSPEIERRSLGWCGRFATRPTSKCASRVKERRQPEEYTSQVHAKHPKQIG